MYNIRHNLDERNYVFQISNSHKAYFLADSITLANFSKLCHYNFVTQQEFTNDCSDATGITRPARHRKIPGRITWHAERLALHAAVPAALHQDWFQDFLSSH